MPDLLVCLRATHFAATLLLVGILCFRHVIAPAPLSSPETGRLRLVGYYGYFRWITVASLCVALLSGVGWVGLLAADASGADSITRVPLATLETFLTETTFGVAFIVRAVAGVLLLVLLLWTEKNASAAVSRPWRAMAALALATVFAASLAWSGHASATEGADGWIHRMSDAVHVLAAGAWVGGLLPLALLLRCFAHTTGTDALALARRATVRFSMLGLISVGSLLLTGTINTWYLAGSLPALLGTLYGRLLLAKTAIFAAMLGIASYNRFRLTPRLMARAPDTDEGSRAAASQLVRTCIAEASFGLGAIGLVAWLGALPPGIHDDAWWPLPFRFVFAAYFDSELRTQTVLATLLVVLGLVMVVTAFAMRRRLLSPALGIAGLAVVIVFGRNLDVLTTEAYPTTFLASPVAFTPQSVVSGQTLFASHCAVCHGASGKGDGPAAAGSKVPPADLTADHLYGHTEGDLFWRLNVGVDDVMPAFGNVLADDDRWRLVSFLQANADAERLASLRGRVTYAAFPAPRFAVQCSGGETRSVEDFAGRSVHLIVAGAASSVRLDQLAALAKSGTGAETIVVDLDEDGDTRFCRTADRTLIAALALYRRGNEDDLDGTEFLIDSRWQFRAMWHKAFGINWIDPIIFRRQIAEMDNPQVLPGNLQALNPEYGDMPRYYPGANEGGAYHSHRH